MIFPRRVGSALAVMLLLSGSATLAQPFTNGGFELVIGTTIASGSAQTLNAGDTWLPGWQAGGPNGSVEVQNGIVGFYIGSDLYGLGPFQGQQWVIFPDDVAGGSISQTFSTAVGSYCTVSFEFRLCLFGGRSVDERDHSGIEWISID